MGCQTRGKLYVLLHITSLLTNHFPLRRKWYLHGPYSFPYKHIWSTLLTQRMSFFPIHPSKLKLLHEFTKVHKKRYKVKMSPLLLCLALMVTVIYPYLVCHGIIQLKKPRITVNIEYFITEIDKLLPYIIFQL